MNWLQDLRFGFRVLLKSPGYSLLTIAVLALGIGATTAIFTVFYAVLLKPLPYHQPDRLYRLYETFGPRGAMGTVSVPNLKDWRDQTSGLDLMAFELGSRSLQDASNAERVRSCAVEARQFQILGAQPLLGRTFTADEDPASKPVLISEALWRKRFGSEAGIIGRSIQLDGAAHKVIGVMPLSFEFPPTSRDPIGVWVPLVFPELALRARGNHSYFALARLRPGVEFSKANDEMKSIAARLARLYPNEQTGRSIKMVPLAEDTHSAIAQPLYILIGAVAVVFLISGTNLANLLLARSASRAAEVSVRAALGASRGRLIYQFLIESSLLAAAGAIMGLLVAQVGLDLILRFGADYIPRASSITINAPVLIFLTALSVLTGVGFGLIPAIRVSNANLGIAMRESSNRSVSGGSPNLRRVLVGAQIALAFLLLIGAGLLLRTLLNLKSISPGFVTENHLTMKLSLPAVRYNSSNTGRFYEQLTDRVRALPGVNGAGLINLLPLDDWGFNGEFAIVGRPPSQRGQAPFAEYRMVTPGYFEAMGIPVLQGRDFSRRDPDGKLTVAIINEKLAGKYFPNQNPIGQRLQLDDKLTQEIVGVVRSVHSIALNQDTTPEIYVLASQSPNPAWVASMDFVVSAKLPPETLVQSVRGILQELDPGLPVFKVRTLEQVVDDSMGSRNLIFYLIVAFAGLALTLALAGVYGVISYLVTARTREFGLRLALGAPRLTLVNLVLGESLILVFGGLIVGALGAFGLSRVLESFLHNVSPADPLTFAVVALGTGLVALAATAIPAWQATRVDPMIALRDL